MTNRQPNPIFDLSGVMEAITVLPNPEQWHVGMSTHPGIGWSIKTIIPSHDIAEPDIIRICDLWLMLQHVHPELVTVTDLACDWAGGIIDGWKTVWIADGWDIRITDGRNGIPSYEILPFQDGSKIIAKEVIDMLADQLAQSKHGDQHSLEELAKVCEAIACQVSEMDSQIMRNSLKVIDE